MSRNEKGDRKRGRLGLGEGGAGKRGREWLGGEELSEAAVTGSGPRGEGRSTRPAAEVSRVVSVRPRTAQPSDPGGRGDAEQGTDLVPACRACRSSVPGRDAPNSRP